MQVRNPTSQSQRVAAAEWIFCLAVTLAWATMVAILGKDPSWDFRNYHWYIPYAFLDGRLGFDVAVAHQATYYNPLLDIPFYWLAVHTHAWFALGVLGAVQGANIIPLYAIARSVLIIEPRRLLAALLSLVCMTGSLTLHLAGTTYYDNVMSVFVLTGVAIVIVERSRLQNASLVFGAALAALGGLFLGVAVGLKLPEAVYALGYAATLGALPGSLAQRAARLVGAAIGGVGGVALVSGFWMHKMAYLTGNPLFPYFNQFFNSPLALHASYRDMRFLPKRLDVQLLFPLLFSIDWRVADDLPFRDIRVGVAYIVVVLTCVLCLIARPPRRRLIAADATFALFVFAAVSYIAWLKMFAIYRYLLLLEILAPILIAAALAQWPLPVRQRLIACAAILLLAMATMKTSFENRVPATDPYVQAAIPPIPYPHRTMVLMTGIEPMGYLAPSFPAQVPILRIDGWMIRPGDGSRLTGETRLRVSRFSGDLYAVFEPSEALRSLDALKSYGLAVAPGPCRAIVTNLGGPYEFCTLVRLTSRGP